MQMFPASFRFVKDMEMHKGGALSVLLLFGSRF